MFGSPSCFGLRYSDRATTAKTSFAFCPAGMPSRDPAADDPLSYNERDQIHLASNAVYADRSMTHWNYWFRTVLGLRERTISTESDSGTNSWDWRVALMFQPKGSLIFTARWTPTEIYVSAGRGFHSYNDLRGVNQAANPRATPARSLIASETGEEIGVRQQLLGQKFAITLAVFNLEAPIADHL